MTLFKSTLFFFGTGVTAAILKAAGATPERRELFKILQTTELTEAKHAMEEVASIICEISVPREIKCGEVWENNEYTVAF